MKFVSVREAKARLSSFLTEAQRQGIVVTNHGKPAAVIVGVQGYDAAEVLLMASPAFWRMIEKRRREATTSLADFEAELKGARTKKSRTSHRRGR